MSSIFSILRDCPRAKADLERVECVAADRQKRTLATGQHRGMSLGVKHNAGGEAWAIPGGRESIAWDWPIKPKPAAPGVGLDSSVQGWRMGAKVNLGEGEIPLFRVIDFKSIDEGLRLGATKNNPR
ncbi:MAG: hypothetical protein AAFR42_19375 [Cyanobacteria bacterium J06628_6]